MEQGRTSFHDQSKHQLWNWMILLYLSQWGAFANFPLEDQSGTRRNHSFQIHVLDFYMEIE